MVDDSPGDSLGTEGLGPGPAPEGPPPADIAASSESMPQPARIRMLASATAVAVIVFRIIVHLRVVGSASQPPCHGEPQPDHRKQTTFWSSAPVRTLPTGPISDIRVAHDIAVMGP